MTRVVDAKILRFILRFPCSKVSYVCGVFYPFLDIFVLGTFVSDAAHYQMANTLREISNIHFSRLSSLVNAFRKWTRLAGWWVLC